MSLKLNADKVPYVDLGGGIHIELDLSEYDDDKLCVEKAREELRETPEIVEASLKQLRELLKDEKDLHVPIDDDKFLKRILRPTKYYAESAFEMLKGFYKTKANKNFILDDLSANAIKVALEEKVIQVFPKRDQHGRRIIYMEMGSKWNSSKVPFPELIRASHGLLTILLLEPRTQLHGFVFVTNFDRLSLAHMGQFGPKFAKITLDYGQKYAPIRVKAINIVNNAKLFNVMFKVFKPFLGQKWGKRIHFHSSDMASLHKHIDASCLPTKLGGTMEWPEYDGKVLVEFAEHYQWYFDGRFELDFR
uniref:Alpha-tocopherol transfer protein-like n=2 Tax=Culex pipiens TaxID=7175 RepID=A0A8D8CAF5_CULPI